MLTGILFFQSTKPALADKDTNLPAWTRGPWKAHQFIFARAAIRKVLPWQAASEDGIGWMQGGGQGAGGAPLAMVAPSGKGAMLVDAESGHLQWLQPSGNPRYFPHSATAICN